MLVETGGGTYTLILPLAEIDREHPTGAERNRKYQFLRISAGAADTTSSQKRERLQTAIDQCREQNAA